MSISVLVVDDRAIVRCGLRSMFQGTDVVVVGEASDVDNAVQLSISLAPDVVLLDIRLDQADGLDILRMLRERSAEVRVIMMSRYDNPTYVARAVALGAKDYIHQSCSRDELLACIRGVAADQPPTRSSILRNIREMMSQRKHRGDFPLTNREHQVLRHLALGLSNREISEFLMISVETVKEHVQNVLRKIHAVDRTSAAVWAVKRGFLQDTSGTP